MPHQITPCAVADAASQLPTPATQAAPAQSLAAAAGTGQGAGTKVNVAGFIVVMSGVLSLAVVVISGYLDAISLIVRAVRTGA